MIYDVCIVGAGAVGLASAYQIAQKYPSLSILVLDKEKEVAFHQTGRNSGVIHSGIYYAPGGSKAINCARGHQLLTDFCDRFGVPYELCGKVIVAAQKEELEGLNRIYKRGISNGTPSIRFMSREETQEREPHVQCVQSIYVPSAGIIDYKVLAQAVAEQLIQGEVDLHFNTEVLGFEDNGDTIDVETSKGIFTSRYLVNCGGLQADWLNRLTGFDTDFQTIPFRGEYYIFKKEYEYLVKHLIYPVPDPAFPFLGVHFTRMKRGGIEAGPNAVLALAREGYKRTSLNTREALEILRYSGTWRLGIKHWRKGIDEYYRSFSKRAFVQSLKRLIPEVEPFMLLEGGAGVRAQALDKRGNMINEFFIKSNHNTINLCNAPSPAATSCLAIGERVCSEFENIYHQ